MNEWGNNPATYQTVAAVVSALGIVAVFASTVLARRALQETKAQRRAVESELAPRMRPWVGLFDCRFELEWGQPGAADTLHLLLKNFGTLPAKNAALTLRIRPLSNPDGAEPIVREEKGAKTLLPQEEGNYTVDLSVYPQFAFWKAARTDVRVEGRFDYSLGENVFLSKFECVYRPNTLEANPSGYKLNWRNQDVT